MNSTNENSLVSRLDELNTFIGLNDEVLDGVVGVGPGMSGG